MNYGKHTVKGAPRIDVKKGFVSELERAALSHYYGLRETG